MGSRLVSLGLDDIDSPTGGCTTHFASLLVEKLEPLIEEWNDYPNLIRFNPNIPYRTRGNGGVCLRFRTESEKTKDILTMVSDMVQNYADLDYPNTNPGAVLVTGDIPTEVKSFSRKALWRTLPSSLALRIIDKYNIDYLKQGNGRGLIGALAAIGNGLESDHTFEYLAYRKLDECNGVRGVDKESIKTMNKIMGDKTFSNIDPSNEHILIEPQGPDPVLFGIRGEKPVDVIEAASYISCKQQVARWMVFRTNQATGEHLSKNLPRDQLRPYISALFTCEVVQQPRIISGGHVFFKASDNGLRIDCAAYEPTGDFRWEVMKLKVGDRLTLHVGVRPASYSYNMTLNIEGMDIHSLTEHVQYENPFCSECGRRMKSAGKNKGFKCPHCKHIDRMGKKKRIVIPREIQRGYYLPPLSAQRHLTRPHSRVGKQNSLFTEPIEKWHNP